jgi:small GTP-binding protein
MSKINEKNREYRLLLIGEQAVGKSSIMNRYVENTFEINIIGTAGLDLKKKIIEINGEQIKIYIFDSAGQERFRSIARNQYKKADGIILIYDITDKKSFESINFWVNSIKEFLINGTECLLIGNKIDLNNLRVVSLNEGEKLSHNLNIPFIETSAKDDINVNQAFMKIIDVLYKKDLNKKIITYSNKNGKKEIQKASGCCYAAS